MAPKACAAVLESKIVSSPQQTFMPFNRSMTLRLPEEGLSLRDGPGFLTEVMDAEELYDRDRNDIKHS